MKMKNRAALSASFPELPPEYIDPEISGRGRQILETFYKACLSEGGTALDASTAGRGGLTFPSCPANIGR